MESIMRHFISEEDMDFNRLDAVPYGSILVDQEGKVLFYNVREAELSGLKKQDVIGKNFFEIAPCVQIGEFYDQFRESIKQTGVFASFHFHFSFPSNPRDVSIVMSSFYHGEDLLCLILIGDLSR